MQNRRAHKGNRGSSLLIALIIMGTLMTLAIGVSDLLIGTLRDSRSLIERTAAWYSAESGIERALLAIAEKPPGFGAEKEIGLTPTARYSYSIRAKASRYPDRDPFEDDTFTDLHLNESVVIPLFDGSDPEHSITEFQVDYYPSVILQKDGETVWNELDILRWKIFGRLPDGRTEVINEFVPADRGISSQHPSCIGTSINCWDGAFFFERTDTRGTGGFNFNDYTLKENYLIREFLANHTDNFLVLTNLIHIDYVGGILAPEEKTRIANIRYRVIAEKDNQGSEKPFITLPTIRIASDGFSGQTKQSIDVETKRDTFLPVFNFALYRIDSDTVPEVPPPL